MENPFTRWLHRRKEEQNDVTLEDVVPMHPEDYPAKHLKEKLDSRRDELHEIEERGHPTGMPEGPNGFL
jgi:hypothetical protein